jgi:hypothetical protein
MKTNPTPRKVLPPVKKGDRKGLAIMAVGSFAIVCVLQNYLKRVDQIIL